MDHFNLKDGSLHCEDVPLDQIADEVGISQMHVSRLIRRSVDALRDTITTPMATAA